MAPLNLPEFVGHLRTDDAPKSPVPSMSGIEHNDEQMTSQVKRVQETVPFTLPIPRYPPFTAPPPHHLLTALRRCPVLYEILLRHPRRVVSTHDELKMCIRGLFSPSAPCVRLAWNLAVAVHESKFCIYRHHRNVIITLLYATLMQLAGALLPGRPQPVSINARKTPLPDIPCPSLLPCPQADRDADTPLRADQPNSTPPTPAQTATRQPPPEICHVVSRTGSALMHASLNVGRPDITGNFFCHLLSGFQPLPHPICLQEFKPSPTAHIRDFGRVALHSGFHLLHNFPPS